VWWARPDLLPSRPNKAQKEANEAAIAFFNMAGSRAFHFVTPPQPLSSFHRQGRTLTEASVEKRTSLSEQLKGMSVGTLLDLWFLEASKKEDELKLELIASTLSGRLRESNNDEARVLSKISDFIKERNQDDFLRWNLIEALGKAATPGALKVLLELVQSAEVSNELKPYLMSQIGNVGDILWGGTFHQELAPPLEQGWKQAEGDESARNVIAIALAKVGAPSSIEILIKEVAAGGRTISEFGQTSSMSAWEAYGALQFVRNLDSVPTLEAGLAANASGDMIMVASGQALASMGRPEATKALLDWIKSDRSDVEVYIDEWLSKMRDQTSVDLAVSVAKSDRFANNTNRIALKKVLTHRKAYRSQ
jgi:hypothetical protein